MLLGAVLKRSIMKGEGYKLLLVLTVALLFLPASSQAQFVYTANLEDDTISGYSIASNGSMVPVPGSPFAGGHLPNSLAVDPSGKFLFVAPKGGTTILGYAIGPNGALTPVPGSPFSQASAPIAVTVHPNGKFVYVTSSGDNVFGYRLDSNGTLTAVPGSPFTAGSVPVSIAVEPKGKYVYVANIYDSTISGYTVEANGALVPTVDSPCNLPDFSPAFIVPTIAKGELVFVSDIVFSWSYRIECQGALVQYPGWALNPGVRAYAMAIDPKGEFAFVANFLGGEVLACKIGDQGDLTPVPGSGAPAGLGESYSMVVDSGGSYVYVANFYGNNVSAYRVGEQGFLTQLPGSPFSSGKGPMAIAITPKSRHPSMRKP